MTSTSPTALIARIDAVCQRSHVIPQEVTALLHLAAGALAGIPAQPATARGRWEVTRRADSAEAYLVDFETYCASSGRLDLALECARIARECAHIARQHLDLADVTRRAQPILEALRRGETVRM